MKQSSFSNASRSIKRRLSLLVIVAAIGFFGYFSVGGTNTAAVAEPQQDPNAAATQDKDYSRFTHTNAYHSRMPCLLCHRRDTNSAAISFPGKSGHTPCIGCHQLQFSDSSSPICTICHTNPQSGSMKGFPGLRSFGRKFDHNRHQRVNCSVCHKSAQGGVALSIPSGRAAHSTCFTCHSASQPMTMSSCNVCHQLGRLVRTSQNAAAYRINFSHSRHNQAGLNCASCHSVRAGRTGQQVSKPLASMHFAPVGKASCAACHNGQRAFGTNDFANCKRCHIGNSFKF
jgi:c(7)-type cytochrome triheme protein